MPTSCFEYRSCSLHYFWYPIYKHQRHLFAGWRGTTQTLFKRSEKVRGERGERTSETCLKNQCWTVEPVTGCSAVMLVGLRGKRSHRSALPAGSCTWAGTAAPAAAAAGHVLRGTCEMLTWRKLQWTDGLQMVLARLGEKILSMFLPSCITLQDDNGTVVSILTESFFSWNLENTNSLNIQALLSILYKKNECHSSTVFLHTEPESNVNNAAL